MRKYLNPILIFVTGLTLGTIGSFLLFGWDSSPNDVDGRDLTRSDLDNSASSQDARKTSDFHGMAASLKDLSELEDAFQRNHELYSMLAYVGEDELSSLLRQSNEIGHAERREQIQVAIVRRIASINPSSALRYTQELPSSSQSSLIYELFRDWATSSLDDAVAEASSLSGSLRSTALRAILETRNDLPHIEVREIGRKLKNETLALKLNTANKVAELIEQPEQAWHIILRDETSDVAQRDLLIEVAEAWRDHSGFEILAHIQEADFADSELRESLVRAVVESDPQGAFAHVQNFSYRDRTVMSRIIAICWARIDPKSALESISSVEPLTLRESLLDSMVESWARYDPTDILDNIDKIGSEQRVNALHFALHALASSSPHEALRRLNELEKFVGEGLYSNNIASIVAAWSRDNPTEAVDWILASHQQDKRRQRELLDWALPWLVHENPHRAVEIAQQHSGEGSSKLELVVIRALTNNGQIELAQEMLPHLQGSLRPSGFALVAISKVKSNESDEVLRLAKELQGRERGLYYTDVFSGWAQFDSVQLFEQIQSFQSLHTRSLAATILIAYNQRNAVLNESQIETAWMHLTDSDRATVERSLNRSR